MHVEYRESCVVVLTESWLHSDIPDSLIDLQGFTCVRQDRDSSSGKMREGGICMYINDNWCKQFTTMETVCDPDLELLCVSLRPFYLSREFGNIIICAAYVPPSGNAARAANCLMDCAHCQLLRTPGAPLFILGDLNHCQLEPVLPEFYQYVKCSTRNKKILDKCFGNIRGAYTARSLPPLSNSDHLTVHLIPTYKTVLKSSKPQRKTVLQWTDDSLETLRGCSECTNWSIFHDLELNKTTETITDYIKFCVETVVPKKEVIHFPNNKPYITKEVKACINKKKLAFKQRDRAGAAAAQKELNVVLRKAREKHRNAIEQSGSSTDNKKLWDSLKKITNMTSKKDIVTSNETDKANALNDFFLRFDSKSFFPLELSETLDHLCSSSNCVRSDPSEIQTIFRKVCNKKSVGPDGLPAFLFKHCLSELTKARCPIFSCP